MCAIFGYVGHDMDYDTLRDYLLRTVNRGPDDQRLVETEFGYIGFDRLAIMDLTDNGMQPFERDGSWVVCNGELYGFRVMKKELEERGYRFESQSDCELLLPLFREYGLEMFRHLDAEFACLIYDAESGQVVAARHAADCP